MTRKPELRPVDLAAELKNRPPGPLYLFHGSETYLVTHGLRLLEERALAAEFRELNAHRFRGDEDPVGAVLESARTLPFLGDRRFVVVQAADRFPAPAQDRLADYVADPAPSTCLVLVADKADFRRRLFVSLRERGRVVACRPLYEQQVPGWLMARAREMGLRLDGEAAQLLLALVGTNLSTLASELEKLAAYCGPQGRVRAEDVAMVTGQTRTHSVFDLARAVGQKDMESALRMLRSMLEGGTAYPFILAMLVRQFRLLAEAKDLEAQGVAQSAIPHRMGLKPFQGREVLAQLPRYSRPGLRNAFARCLQADLALKTSVAPPHRVLERLLMDLAGQG